MNLHELLHVDSTLTLKWVKSNPMSSLKWISSLLTLIVMAIESTVTKLMMMMSYKYRRCYKEMGSENRIQKEQKARHMDDSGRILILPSASLNLSFIQTFFVKLSRPWKKNPAFVLIFTEKNNIRTQTLSLLLEYYFTMSLKLPFVLI